MMLALLAREFLFFVFAYLLFSFGILIFCLAVILTGLRREQRRRSSQPTARLLPTPPTP
jgi:hypothetical protein